GVSGGGDGRSDEGDEDDGDDERGLVACGASETVVGSGANPSGSAVPPGATARGCCCLSAPPEPARAPLSLTRAASFMSAGCAPAGRRAGAPPATEAGCSVTAAFLSASAGAISVATIGISATEALAPISPNLPRPPRASERKNGASEATLSAPMPLRTCWRRDARLR